MIPIRVFLTCAFFCFLAAANPAAADIYKYIDANGVLHFTNVPTTAGYRLYVRERPRNTDRFQTPTRYDHLIRQAAITHGLSFDLIKAMIKVESDFNPRAVSSAGALGLMQIMPENLAALRIQNPFDPWENIRGGSRYLTEMLQRFDGELTLALAAYNAGPTAVERYRRIPPFPETEAYVEKVMTYYAAFRRSS